MDQHTLVWGLDIGHTSIKAVKLQRAGDQVLVIGYAMEPIASGEDTDRDEAVVAALTNLAKREEMRNVPVIAGLSGRQILAKTINVPVINPKKVERMVELEARQQIPGDFEDVRWDYHMSAAADGSSHDIALFAARNEVVADLIAKCKRAGVGLVGIATSSIAVYNFVQYDQNFKNDETIIVLDVGAENTDLVIYRGDTVWMRNLSISGNDITRAFMKKFRVSFEEAETLKTQVGDSRQSERILKVVEASLVELVSEVQRSLGFYKSQNPDATFENVVVSGGTFRLPGLAQFLADRLGYAIITLIELERIQVAPGLERVHFLEDLQSLGVAMGLSLQGLGLGRARIDLMPADLRLQTILKTKRWAAAAILGMIPVSFLACHLIQLNRLDESAEMKRNVTKRVADFKGRHQSANAIANELQPSIDRAMEYRNFGAHVGVLSTIESQILKLVQDVALDPTLAPKEAGDPERGGDPAPQALYFESLKIPELAIGGDASPFEQLAQPRRVVLVVRIPTGPKEAQVATLMQNRLREMTVPPALLRTLRPGQPPSEKAPPLFATAVNIGGAYPEDFWNYENPQKYNEKGEIAPVKLAVKLPVHRITFECDLAQQGGMP